MQLVERVCNQSAGLAGRRGAISIYLGINPLVWPAPAHGGGLTNHPSQTAGLLGLIGLASKGVSLSVERMSPVKHGQIKKHTMKEMICIRKCPSVKSLGVETSLYDIGGGWAVDPLGIRDPIPSLSSSLLIRPSLFVICFLDL